MPPPRLYKTEAIVLRQRKLGEADRIVTLCTPAYGKLEAKAKGVRKTSSRMGGHLQPLTHCMVQLAQGRVNEVVAGCQTIESFQGLREDLDRLSRALYAAELVDRFAPERAASLGTYRLLLETLRRLEAGPVADRVETTRWVVSTAAVPEGEPWTSAAQDLALRYFEMRLLDESGFRPELERCVICGSSLQPQQNFFSPQSGGAVCPVCASGAGGPRALSLNGLKMLRLLQRGPYREAARVKVPPELAREVERHLRSYIVCVLERDVNSAAFMERLRREEMAQQSIEV